MKEPRRATDKDKRKFLRLINKWANRFGGERWAGTLELCKCEEHDDAYAHVDMCSRSHLTWIYLHHVDQVERTALHEQLHIEMAQMHRVVEEMKGILTEEQWHCAYEWYRTYEDEFIRRMTKALLEMDKEIRGLKWKVKKLEKK